MDTSSVLGSNYFTLFGIAQNYIVDKQQLAVSYRELQKQFHPDNFATTTTELSTQALVVSSYINEAYQTLCDPLARAIYLLQQQGIKLDLVHATSYSSEFLHEQISWREQIEEATAAHDFSQLTELEQRLNGVTEQVVEQLTVFFAKNDWDSAQQLALRLAFYQKLHKLVDNSLAAC